MGFFYEHIVYPMLYGKGYNIYTTLLVTAVSLVSFYVIWKLVKNRDQEELRRKIFPWFLFGGALRFLDPRLFHSFFTITPGIWFLVGIPALFFYFKFPKLCNKIGWALFFLSLFVDFKFLNFSRLDFFIYSLLLTAFFSFIFSKIPWMQDKFAWVPQVYEAWISSFGVLAGLYEEHVFARFIMGFHPLIFGLVKTIALPIIFYFIRDLSENERVFVGSAIAALAIGPSFRNTLELLSL